MVDVLDLMNKGRTHLPFNAAFLRIVAKAYPGCGVRFAAHASLVDAMSEMSDLPPTVAMHALPDTASVTETSRTGLRDTGAVAYLKQNPLAENVVLMGARPWFLAALHADKALLARAQFDIVFHATLAEQARWRSRSPLARRADLFGVLGRKYPPNLRFVLLEHAIEANVRKYLRPDTRTTVLEHPSDRPAAMPERPGCGDRLRIAFIGAPTRAKGFPSFREAAKRSAGRFEFCCFGRADASYDRSEDAVFTVPPSAEKLSQADFDRHLASADLVCLPLDRVHYSWSASGTLLDCVRFGVPPITVRTAVVDALAARYGSFGYFAESPEEIPALVAALDPRRVADDAEAFRTALDRIAADRSSDALAARFRLNTV